MKINALLICLILLSGCKSNNVGVDPDNNLKYPAKLNNQWEYSSTMTNEYLDNSGLVNNTETIDLPNTIIRISSVNDSLPGYKDLVKIDAYNSDSPGSISENWYINNDSTFSVIAYRNAGTSYPIIPKSHVKKYLTLAEFKKICEDLTFSLMINSDLADSVLYFAPPRVVLKYPLYTGAEWNELTIPFYRDRIVKGITSLEVNNSYYDCFVIEADMKVPNLKMIDYISLQAGLIKREIISDSIAITGEGSPDTAIGYMKGHDVSILVNKNF
jgi:hypothetical protein